MKKEAFSNSLLFELGKRTWCPRIFAKITKLSLQQVGKTTWQIQIHVMPSDRGLSIFTESAFAPFVGFGVLMAPNLGTNALYLRFATAVTLMKDSKV